MTQPRLQWASMDRACLLSILLGNGSLAAEWQKKPRPQKFILILQWPRGGGFVLLGKTRSKKRFLGHDFRWGQRKSDALAVKVNPFHKTIFGTPFAMGWRQPTPRTRSKNCVFGHYTSILYAVCQCLKPCLYAELRIWAPQVLSPWP